MTASLPDRAPWREIIGLIPAGGHAQRLSPLPCSKELYPVGFRSVDDGRSLRPKVVCHYLLEKMAFAGINKVYIVIRQGKWDIPNYLGDGSMLNLNLGYLMTSSTLGAPYTLDQAHPFVQDALVAFGFPDILFRPDDAFVQLLRCQGSTDADISLGIFPAHQPHVMDMVDVDGNGRIRSIIIKPSQTQLQYAWIFAVWTPVFTRFMHEFLQTHKPPNGNSDRVEREELSVGHVIQASIHNGLRAHAVTFNEGAYLDIGTPDDLVRAVQASAKLL
jgi:glucose-1-phosphate thymidylyltransferase